MKKRIGFLLVVLAMLLTVTVAQAADTRTSGLYTYEIKGNGTITITGFNWRSSSGDIYIPSMIDGYQVTAIGDEAFKCDAMRRSGSSWKNENNFDTLSLTLPDSVRSIGNKAFWNATLSAINLPEGLQSIGYGAFVGNPTIQFKISGSHPYFAVINGALYSKANKELLAYTHIDEKYDQYKHYSYSVPEGILSIADYAFYRDNEAEAADAYKNEYFIDSEKIQLPSTVQRIGSYAFSGFRFDSGSSIMPEHLQSIGESAFKGAAGYIRDDIVIPPSVTSIGKAAFQDCNILFDFGQDGEYGGIVLPQACAIAAIEENTFRNCQDKVVVLTDGIRRVAPYAFYCAQWVVWEHTESIDDWGEYAFANQYEISILSDAYVFGGGDLNIRYGTVLSTAPDFTQDHISGALAYINTLPEEEQESAMYQFEMGTLRIPGKGPSLSPMLTQLPAGFEWDVTLPDTVRAISSHAFNSAVTDYRLPSSLNSIAADAFPKGSTFVVDAGSYAELWCSENGFGYSIEGQEDDLSWLNN